MVDLSKLEHNFREYVGSLPNYKRTEVWAYVYALRGEITKRDTEIHELAELSIERGKIISLLQAQVSDLTSNPPKPKVDKSFLDNLTDEQWLKLYEYALSTSPQMERIKNDEPITDAPVHFQPDQ